MQTTKHLFRVRRRDIDYIRTTVESYDGAAVVRTVDPYEASIEIQIAPGCEGMIFALLDYLKTHEDIMLKRKW